MDPSLLQKALLIYGFWYFVFYVLVGSIVISVQNWRMREDMGKRVNFWRFLLLGTVLLAIFLVGSLSTARYMAPKKTWTEMTSEEGGFSASFPGEPQRFSGDVPASSGTGNVPTIAYSVNGGALGVTYTVGYMDYSSERVPSPENIRSELEKIRDVTIMQHHVKLKYSEFITHGPYQGIDYVYQSPSRIGVIRNLAFIKGARVYQVWAGPLTGISDPNGTPFFESFKLTAPEMGPVSPKSDK